MVLDTNVALSALALSADSFVWLRDSWKSRRVLLLVSRVTEAELGRVLSYQKFAMTAEDQSDLLEDYLPYCEMVDVGEPPVVPDCRDPSDRPFLELALAGRADALVTGDNDLLALATVFSVPIITPDSLRDMLFS